MIIYSNTTAEEERQRQTERNDLAQEQTIEPEEMIESEEMVESEEEMIESEEEIIDPAQIFEIDSTTTALDEPDFLSQLCDINVTRITNEINQEKKETAERQRTRDIAEKTRGNFLRDLYEKWLKVRRKVGAIWGLSRNRGDSCK